MSQDFAGLEIQGRNVSSNRGSPQPNPEESREPAAVSEEKKKKTKIGLSGAASAQNKNKQWQSKAILEEGLVTNLKQQIHCLEDQVRVLKERLNNKNMMESNALRGKQHDRQTSPANIANELRPIEPLFFMNTVLKGAQSESALKVGRGGSEPRTQMLGSNNAGEGSADPKDLYVTGLEHKMEALINDFNETQNMCLYLQREKEEMAREIADLHRTIRDLNDESSAMRKEKETLLKEVNAKTNAGISSQSNFQANGGANSAALENVTQQRDFFKLQLERSKMAQNLASSRCEAMEEALAREREVSSQLEQQLCAALDRITFFERREESSSEYYSNLNSRFITLSAILRRMVDPNDFSKPKADALNQADVKGALKDLAAAHSSITVQKSSKSQERKEEENEKEAEKAKPPTSTPPRKKAPPVMVFDNNETAGAVPLPPPVAVPTKGGVPLPPTVTVPTKSGVPQPPAPPTLQAQLDTLDAKIEKEMHKLSQLVEKA